MLWTGFSFLEINEKKRVGMVSTKNLEITLRRSTNFIVETIPHYVFGWQIPNT